MTDAQRYGKQVVVNPINITAGEAVPDPKLANSLTLPVRTNEINAVSLVVNNGTAAELPAGTTAEWANKAQVEADAQHAGNYAEDVLVTFPDGSQVTVKAQMNVAAKTTTSGATNTSKGSTTVNNGTATNGNNGLSQAATGNGAMSNTKSEAAGATENSFTIADGENSNIMTREAYKASQKAQKSVLPQTGDAKQTGLVALGLAAASMLAGALGFQKREN